MDHYPTAHNEVNAQKDRQMGYFHGNMHIQQDIAAELHHVQS